MINKCIGDPAAQEHIVSCQFFLLFRVLHAIETCVEAENSMYLWYLGPGNQKDIKNFELKIEILRITKRLLF